MLFSIYVAFFIAPSLHPNHPVSENRANRLKKAGRFFCVVECVLIIMFYFIFPAWVSQVAGLGLFFAALLCMIGKLVNSKLNP